MAREAEIGGALGADASGEFCAVFYIGGGFHDGDFLAAFLVVEGDLEELHGFAAAHGAVAEVEFAHENIIADL